jgi:hypothetical protein
MKSRRPVNSDVGRLSLMANRPVNASERYLLVNYQNLMAPHERMVARSLIAADFNLDQIPRAVWRRVWLEFPGIDRNDPWKLPIQICLGLLHNHRDEIHLPAHLEGDAQQIVGREAR